MPEERHRLHEHAPARRRATTIAAQSDRRGVKTKRLSVSERIAGGAWFRLDPSRADGSLMPDGSVLLDLTLVGGIALLTFLFSGIGSTGSDDSTYILAALEWLRDPPYVSHFFGDLRYPAILPISLSVLLFGDSEAVVAIPSLLYALGSVLVIYLFIRALTDRWTAVIASLLFAASPLLGELSTTAGVDDCELFLLLLSLFTFLYATQRQGGPTLYLIAGLAAGLAFLTRESTIELLLFYGVLFLVGFGGRRSVYWQMAAGFVAVLGSEMLFYVFSTGDPLYRLKLVAAAAQMPDANGAVSAVDFHSVRIFDIAPAIDPLLFVLAHPKFALVFAAAAGALVWTAVTPDGRVGAGRVARHFLLLGALSFLVAAFVLGYLALIPRYFLVSVGAMTIAVAIWIRHGLWPRHRRAAVAVTAILLAADLFGAAISNKSPLFAERVLASLASRNVEPIHTDVATVFRGRNLFRWAVVTDRITAEPAKPGDLFFYNPKYIGAQYPPTTPADWATYTPKPGWTVMARVAEPQKPLVVLLRSLGLDKTLPDALVDRMSSPPAVVLYRTGR
jgi:hypothetical protein